MAKLEPLPCLCGEVPIVQPEDPKEQGDAWAEVQCGNEDCPANPVVADGDSVADDRGSDAYKQLAVERWNRWISGNWKGEGNDD